MQPNFLLRAAMCLIACGLLSCASTEPSRSAVDSTAIEGHELRIRLKNSVTIRLWSVEEARLRIRAETPDSPYTPTELTWEMDQAGSGPVRTQEGYSLAGYGIKPTEGGFIVSKGDKPLYRDSYSWDEESGIMTNLRECFDEESFSGMGGVSPDLDLANRAFKIYNHAEYGNQSFLYVPFFFSSGGDSFYTNAGLYDIFFFGDPEKAEAAVRTTYGHVDYYYSHHPSAAESVKDFYSFSRSKSLLPKWAYGYIQSKYGYRNQKEVTELVETFTQKKIPLSAVVLDLYWFKRMGDLDWDRAAFPNPEALDALLEKKGIKLITITEPYYTEDSKNYSEFAREGYFIESGDGEPISWSSWWAFGKGRGSMINLWAMGAAEALGQKYVDMMETGIDAFWTDLGEPEESPDEAIYSGMPKEDVHNYYNREWSRIISDAVTRAHPDRRPFILSRSGTTGSTAYGVSVWSGDVSSNWAALGTQPVLGMGAGLVGFPYWGSDVGGFVSQGLPERELWIRWHQFGLFSPVYRAHGAQSPREPWTLAGEPERIVTEQIRLRQRLLPYIYSTAYQTWKNGLPMMRPIFLEHKEVTGAGSEKTAYYFGQNLLVFPVAQSLRTSPRKQINLPAGTWYDFYTWEPLPGGEHTVALTLEHLPVYVPAGAVIPQEEEEGLRLLLVPDADTSTFLWYEDDGVSLSYLEGLGEERMVALSRTGVKISGVKNTLTVKLSVLEDSVLHQEGWKKNGRFMEKTVRLKPGENSFEW